MKKEFIRFFTRKYILVLVPIILVLTIFGWSKTFNSNNYNKLDSVYSNFIEGISQYDSYEELQQLYDKLYIPTTNIPNLNTSENESKVLYFKSLYELALKENLPYDSFVEITNFKYTHFHYYSYFCMYMCLFIILTSIIIGAFYQTSDFLNKTAKIIYTSGEKRSKIIFRKYITSILSLTSIVILADTIFAFLGLRYSFTGAKYSVIFVDNTLFKFTYSQFVCFNIFSHIILLCSIYTFVYFLSAIFKNGIITSCSCLAIVLLITFFGNTGEQNIVSIFLAMCTQGIAALTFNSIDTMNYIALYLPFILIPIVTAIVSNIIVKKIDYSR